MNGKGKLLRVAATVLLSLLVALSPALSGRAAASSYGSWIQDSDAYREFYGTSRSTPTGSGAAEDDENFLIKALAALIHYVGAKMSASDKSSDADLTIDGIIMGKVAQPGGVSYVSFDLSAGNVYGTTGATIYVIFRGLAYSGMIIVFAWLLLRALVNASPKAREELKAGCSAIVVNFSLIYLMPQVIDLAIFLRDVVLVRILTAMGSRTSITDALEAAYQSNKSLITAVVYTAAVAAGLFYLKDYVSIAIQQTVLFGFFCAFTVMGVLKKKFLSDWCNMFFSNLLVPVVDLACIMMPYSALKVFGSGGRRISFAQSLIILFMVWSARAARVQMMRLFGSVTGSPAGRGLAGLATMAQLARMAHRRARGGDESPSGRKSNPDRFDEWQDEASSQREDAEGMNRQGREIARGLGDAEEAEGSFVPGQAGADDFLAGQEEAEVPEEGQESGSPGDGESEGGLSEERESGQDDAQETAEDVDEACDAGDASRDAEALWTGGDEAEDLSGGDLSGFGSEGGDALADAGEDLPAMTEFERRRYANLREMDDLRDSIEDANSLVGEKASENAAIESGMKTLSDAEGDAAARDAAETERLSRDGEALDGVMAENEADERRLKELPEEGGEEAAAIRERMEARTDDYVSGANAADEDRYQKLAAERDAVNERLNTAGAGERDALLLKRGECEEGMRLARERIDSRGRDLAAEKEKNLRDERAIRRHAGERAEGVRKRTEEMKAAHAENARTAAEARDASEKMRRTLAERERAEGRFSQVSRDYGRDGAKYQSAEDMRLAVERRNERLERARIAASRRGGLSRDALKDLSPEGAAEVAAIQSEAIRKSNLKRAVAGAARTAAGIGIVTAGAAVGATVLAYGGEDASVTGAYLAGSVAGGVAGAASKAARKAWENRSEIAADAAAAGRAVGDAVQTAMERDRKAFSGGSQKPAAKTPGPSLGVSAPKKGAETPREALSREASEALSKRDRGKAKAPDGSVRDGLEREAENALDGRNRKNRKEG